MRSPTPEERLQRDAVFGAVIDCIRRDVKIRLPEFDGSGPGGEFALQSVGCEPNPFGGEVGPFRYQFEGEDDLLHLMVLRKDGGEVSPEEAQHVASFLLPDLPSALIWLKPGVFSQHFYFGHDELL